LGVCTWNLKKQFSRHLIQVDNFVHKNEPIPYSAESTPLWTFKQFSTTHSTWGFYFPRFHYALSNIKLLKLLWLVNFNR
jgi:hypothetical protein